MTMVQEAEDQGRRADIIPGMGVFTRKAGDGRRRARIVCCGNYMETRTGEEVYASGADSTQLRATLRVASLNNWHCLSLDVKSAFLLAPKAQGYLVIVKPPKVLVDASLANLGEHWVVTSAMYGLVTSPKDWSVYRDSELRSLKEKETGMNTRWFGFRPLEDSNLWAIQEWKDGSEKTTGEWGVVLGYMIVYVDDILMVGSRPVTDAASATIKRIWATSNPEYAEPGGAPMRFLGIEIQRLVNGAYYLHQGCYVVREVLDRHVGGGSSSFIKVPEEKEENAPSLREVREAQKITGELLWLSGKTRPDIAWAVMKMSQWAVKRPRWTVELGEAILAYVRSSVDFGLVYPVDVPVDDDPDLARKLPRKRGTIEVLVDASYSPGEAHSVSGTVVLLAGCPVQWESRKQSLMSLSTAESQLTALVEGLQTGRSVRALVELLIEDVTLELYNDNRAAVVMASGSGGGWRTRHLRIRARCLAEALKLGEVTLSHRMGTSLWADALTKALPAQSLDRFCRGVLLRPGQENKMAKTQNMQVEESVKVSKCVAMMLTGISMIPQAAGSEVCEKGEAPVQSTTSMMGDLGWLVMLAGLVCFLHLVKDLGLGWLRRLVAGKECVKVKLLHEEATTPQRGSPGAAGWDLSTCMSVQIGPGERKLVSTGVAMEISKGFYGRVASHSSASRGLEVAGVIDSDYRGEVKVILVNHGNQEASFEVGDRIAQIVIEKISEAPMMEVSDLSSSARGGGGFGSSGLAVRSVRATTSTSGEESLHHERPRVQEGVPRDEGALRESEKGVEMMNMPIPRSLDFETYTSRAGEDMTPFLGKLRDEELPDVAWLFNPSVMNILVVKPSNGMNHECVLRFQEGVVTVKIFRHGGWRKKIFDSDLALPVTATGLSSKVVTVAWLDDGRLLLRSDCRKGSHQMHYLRQRWFGYSILLRSGEPLSSASGSAGWC